MNRVIQFGESVAGFQVPVLNEREIRAAAGLLFLMMFISVMFVMFQGNFVPLKYALSIFLADMLTRVLISPRYSPSLILGRLIVAGQAPEYVSAEQKKFAWKIGIALGSTFFVLIALVNAYSPITGIACLVCLVFMFSETAFGICLGCKLYPLVYGKKPELCPGEACVNNAKEDIQRMSSGQWLVLPAFVTLVLLLSYTTHDYYRIQPYDMFGINVEEPLVNRLKIQQDS